MSIGISIKHELRMLLYTWYFSISIATARKWQKSSYPLEYVLVILPAFFSHKLTHCSVLDINGIPCLFELIPISFQESCLVGKIEWQRKKEGNDFAKIQMALLIVMVNELRRLGIKWKY